MRSPENYIVRPAGAVDALTSVLREMRFESVGYRWLEPVAPFSLDFDQHQLRGVHAVREGSCELVLADGTTEVLRPGDVAVLPRGDSHVFARTMSTTGA